MFGERKLTKTMKRGDERMDVDLLHTPLEVTRERARGGWRFERDEDR